MIRTFPMLGNKCSANQSLVLVERHTKQREKRWYYGTWRSIQLLFTKREKQVVH